MAVLPWSQARLQRLPLQEVPPRRIVSHRRTGMSVLVLVLILYSTLLIPLPILLPIPTLVRSSGSSGV